jgi:hypothetical protein
VCSVFFDGISVYRHFGLFALPAVKRLDARRVEHRYLHAKHATHPRTLEKNASKEEVFADMQKTLLELLERWCSPRQVF